MPAHSQLKAAFDGYPNATFKITQIGKRKMKKTGGEIMQYNIAISNEE